MKPTPTQRGLRAWSFPRIAALASLVLAGACSTVEKLPGDMRFSEYSGADASEWPTSTGALADKSYAVPVYRAWPSKPYVVIGEVRHAKPHKHWEDDELRDAAKAASKRGGEAIIFRRTTEAGVAALTGTLERGPLVGTGVQWQQSALVIRWQTPEETQDRQARNARLLSLLAAAKPDLQCSEDTAKLVIKYLLQTAVRGSVSDLYPNFERIMGRISPAQPGSLAGEWLFKATITIRSLVDSDEQSHLGLAFIRVDGNNLVIVSTEGGVELNFSGQATNSGLTGQLGISGFPVKAEGVALDDKISLTFQSTTPNGVFQGEVILQRNRLKLSPNRQQTLQQL
jgi:hypothetical protein